MWRFEVLGRGLVLGMLGEVFGLGKFWWGWFFGGAFGVTGKFSGVGILGCPVWECFFGGC